VGVKRIDAETAELTAGAVRSLRRAAEVAQARSEADSSTPCAEHRSGSRRGTEPSVGRDQRRGPGRSRGSCCAAAVGGAGIERLHGRGSGRLDNRGHGLSRGRPGDCSLWDSLPWTRVGVMKGRSSSGIGSSRIGPEQSSHGAPGASHWTRSRTRSDERGRHSLEGGDIKIKGMTT
jgi:hypothetical protein